MEEESTFLNSKSHFINANLHFMTRYALSLVNVPPSSTHSWAITLITHLRISKGIFLFFMGVLCLAWFGFYHWFLALPPQVFVET